MDQKAKHWAAFSTFSLVFGALIGYYVAQRTVPGTPPAAPSPVGRLSADVETLVLDALQAQARARATDPRFDAAQQETIGLLIPQKLDELRANGLTQDDLVTLATLYRMIEQPNGLRATRDGAGRTSPERDGRTERP